MASEWLLWGVLLVVRVWMDGGSDVFDAFIFEGFDVVLFGVVWLCIILLLLLWQAGYAHSRIPKAVEDVDAAWAHAGGRLWEGLQHGCQETGEDVVNFGNKEGGEAGVAVADGCALRGGVLSARRVNATA